MSLKFRRSERRYSEINHLFWTYLEEIAIFNLMKPLVKLYKLGNTP